MYLVVGNIDLFNHLQGLCLYIMIANAMGCLAVGICSGICFSLLKLAVPGPCRKALTTPICVFASKRIFIVQRPLPSASVRCHLEESSLAVIYRKCPGSQVCTGVINSAMLRRVDGTLNHAEASTSTSTSSGTPFPSPDYYQACIQTLFPIITVHV